MSDPDAASQPDAQPAPTDDDHDQLVETIDRARYDERTAAGSLGNEGDLFIVARVNDHHNPVLLTYAGGRLERYPDEPTLDPEYVGSDTTQVRQDFDHVDHLDAEFQALVERHDLDELDADEEGA